MTFHNPTYIMSDVILSQSNVRHAVARLIATYFVVHLEAEVAKSDEVLYEDYPDLPIREITRTWIDRVRHEFAIGDEEKMPSTNIFQKWCALNGKFAYEEAGLFGYNRFFLPRVLDLREGTPESQEIFFSAVRDTFDGFDYEKQGYTVSFFLNSESNMRELIRDAVHQDLPQFGKEADAIVLRQSAAFQTAMYEYFEKILKTALADNVRLLNGILPESVTAELKKNGVVAPVYFTDAAVIFTDFENFSHYTEHLEPAEVIHRLDTYFTAFDKVSAAHGLEKIKTIGDSYMAVAGVPEEHPDPVHAACNAALEISEVSRRISDSAGANGWKLRIGIHAGPLVAGVIGRHKFSYDVWGATVNFASRMESSGAPGRINVSAEVHSRVESDYLWEARGPHPVKNLGMAEMYFLLGKK
jgi:class 3 adenylate cyclase